MPLRWTIAGACAAAVVLAGLLTPTLASAAPGTTPTITSPSDGATPSAGPLSVSASSSAAVVEFVLDGGHGGLYTVDANVDGTGNASANLPLAGLNGATTLQAFDCDAGAPVDCNSSPATIGLTINLPAPAIDTPSDGAFVRNTVTVTATAGPGGGLAFFLDGTRVDFKGTTPYTRDLTISAQGDHTIFVRRCDDTGAVCQGPDSPTVTVTKNTVRPAWTKVSASPSPFYPHVDKYRDSTTLSAHVGTALVSGHVVIRHGKGTPVVAIPFGPVGPGKVHVSWNGHGTSGGVVPHGRYRFRFVGTDAHGNIGRSKIGVVKVSAKVVKRLTVHKRVTPMGSAPVNKSRVCGEAFRLDRKTQRPFFRGGIGYYSNYHCDRGLNASVALVTHQIRVAKALRFGSLRIDTFGGAAVKHGGRGHICYFPRSGTCRASSRIGRGVSWHRGRTVAAGPYVKGGTIGWGFYTFRGAWYNVGKFRITYTYFALRAP